MRGRSRSGGWTITIPAGHTTTEHGSAGTRAENLADAPQHLRPRPRASGSEGSSARHGDNIFCTVHLNMVNGGGARRRTSTLDGVEIDRRAPGRACCAACPYKRVRRGDAPCFVRRTASATSSGSLEEFDGSRLTRRTGKTRASSTAKTSSAEAGLRHSARRRGGDSSESSGSRKLPRVRRRGRARARGVRATARRRWICTPMEPGWTSARARNCARRRFSRSRRERTCARRRHSAPARTPTTRLCVEVSRSSSRGRSWTSAPGSGIVAIAAEAPPVLGRRSIRCTPEPCDSPRRRSGSGGGVAVSRSRSSRALLARRGALSSLPVL